MPTSGRSTYRNGGLHHPEVPISTRSARAAVSASRSRRHAQHPGVTPTEEGRKKDAPSMWPVTKSLTPRLDARAGVAQYDPESDASVATPQQAAADVGGPHSPAAARHQWPAGSLGNEVGVIAVTCAGRSWPAIRLAGVALPMPRGLPSRGRPVGFAGPKGGPTNNCEAIGY